MNSTERMEAVMADQPVDRLPVQPIMMTFAARFGGHKYGEYLSDYRVMAECQIRTTEAFDLDIVTLCSDPTRETEDLGGHAEWFDDAPTAHAEADSLLADKAMLAGLKPADPLGGGRMHDRVKGNARLRELVGDAIPVNSWIEGPMALAADLRGINRVMLDLVDDPGWIKDLFAFCVEQEIAFARAQVEAGGTVMGIGDAASSLIGPDFYHGLVFDYERQLVKAVQAMGVPVRLHICGRIDQILDDIARLGVEQIDIDYPTDLSICREKLGPEVTILGNFEPVGVLKNGSPEFVRNSIAECRRQVPGRFIVCPGCEVPPATPHRNVHAMVESATELADGA